MKSEVDFSASLLAIFLLKKNSKKFRSLEEKSSLKQIDSKYWFIFWQSTSSNLSAHKPSLEELVSNVMYTFSNLMLYKIIFKIVTD